MYIIMRAAVQIREIFSFSFVLSSFSCNVWISVVSLSFFFFFCFCFCLFSSRSVSVVCVCIRVVFVSIRPLDARVCLHVAFLCCHSVVVTRTFVCNFSSRLAGSRLFVSRPLAPTSFLSYSLLYSPTLTLSHSLSSTVSASGEDYTSFSPASILTRMSPIYQSIAEYIS